MQDEDCCQLSAGLGRGHCSWCGRSLQGIYAGLIAPGEALPGSVAARRWVWARARVRRALSCLKTGDFTADELGAQCLVSTATIERILLEEARAGRLVERVGEVSVTARTARRLYRVR